MAVDNLSIKVYEYKIRANKKFTVSCEAILTHCQHLYNACLEQRISFYRSTGVAIRWAEQSRQLTELRAEDVFARSVPRAIQEAVIKRVEITYQAFFRRVKNGDTPGFPRFRTRQRYKSFEYSSDARKPSPLRGDKLIVYGVGSCRVRLSRPVEGAIRTVRIIRRADGYYAQLVCKVEKPVSLPKTNQSIGVDVGIESFATLSTGEQVENPRFTEKAEASLAKAQRKLSRKKKGSQNRKKARLVVAQKHLKVARARRHFHYQVANNLVKRFDSIFVESLNMQGMVKNPYLAKSITSAAWFSFFRILTFKAEDAGREVKRVNAKYTSQICSGCGLMVRKKLSRRKHICPECGLDIHRDHNAALNIRSRGLAVESEVTVTTKQERSIGCDSNSSRLCY